MTRAQRLEDFQRLLSQRILVLDGAMGTMIQASKRTRPLIAASVSAIGPAISRATTIC